jgi:hypothetical protein
MVMEPTYAMADTVEMMMSEDYRQRFVAEYVQTKLRYERLRKMLNKLDAGVLEFKPKCSRELLMEQAMYMGNYLRCLEIRAEIEKIEL